MSFDDAEPTSTDFRFPSSDLSKLRTWFQNHARDLPWRRHPSPYAVWISEVMLQQTQVATVIPYFERWMQQYPSIKHLALAPLDDVIKAWEGLGYYSRARHLHAGARQIVESFGGQLPNTEADLKTIKGLGPYTVGAIRAFAFRQRAAAVDGNVMRVLARYYAIEDDLIKPKTIRALRQRALELLPRHEPWVIAEALIELGATTCNRQPRCSECPLNNSCTAYAQGLTDRLPYKSVKAATLPLYRSVALVVSENHALIRCCGQGEVMADLHEFPYRDASPTGSMHEELRDELQKHWRMDLQVHSVLEEVKHSFTRYRVTLFPVLFKASKPKPIEGFFWHPIKSLAQLPFSAGHRRLAQLLMTDSMEQP